mgnify:CR=1 FL=1
MEVSGVPSILRRPSPPLDQFRHCIGGSPARGPGLEIIQLPCRSNRLDVGFGLMIDESSGSYVMSCGSPGASPRNHARETRTSRAAA